MRDEIPATQEGRKWLIRELNREIEAEAEKMDRARKRIEFKQKTIEEIRDIDRGKINGL